MHSPTYYDFHDSQIFKAPVLYCNSCDCRLHLLIFLDLFVTNLNMTSESAIPSSSVRLSVVTMAEGEDDAFPDFSDPNLFTVSLSEAELAADTNPRTRTNSVMTTGSQATSSASPTESPVSNAATHSGSKFLLPIPTPSTNVSQTSFALSEWEAGEGGLAELPPEILSADISISGELPLFNHSLNHIIQQSIARRLRVHLLLF